jgi:hypothetical protein
VLFAPECWNDSEEGCLCQTEDELGTMLLSTSMFMTWNGRWADSKTGRSFLFHPHPDRPTEPNAGLIRYEPGASYPLHRHDFAQVWYILEGEMTCGGTTYGPGTFVYMPDPHFEHEMTTKSGCTVVFLQYPGPTTGAPAIYEGRMNLREPESPQDYDLNR